MLRALLAALLLLPAVAGAQTTHDVKPSWWLPFAGSGWIDIAPADDGHIVIPVMLNGAPAWALVDTGFENMTLTKRYADAHGLRLVPWNTAMSFGGRTAFYMTAGVTMSVGTARTQRPATFVVVDIGETGTVATHPIDVIIGLDLLAYFGWEVDEDHHRFRLLPSGAPAAGARTVLRRRADGTRLVADIQLAGHGTVAAVLDTGSDSELDLAPAAAEQAGIRTATDIEEIGAGGDQINAIGRAPPIAIGGQAVTDARAEVDPHFGQLWGTDVQAMIGMGLLRRYNLSVDFPAGGIALRPRATPAPPLPVSTSGIQGDSMDGHIRITHVMLHSPAAAAGLKAGDSICGVNNWTAAEALARHFGRAAPGTRYVVHLCDGRTVPLVTRAFY